MELTQLKYFITVAEELHFGNAARRLHMTQPPLSMQIKKLEDELEVALFRRTNRSVALTREGELFLKDALEIVNRAENAMTNIRSLSETFRGPFKIGFNEPAINSFLPTVLKTFGKRCPGVKLSLNELETADQLERLRQCEISIGFVRLFEQDTTGLKYKQMREERYRVALPTNHRLSHHDRLTPNMLVGEPLVVFPRRLQPRLYDRFMTELEFQGYKPDHIQEAITKQTTLALVEAGMGIAFVPESIARIRRKGVVYRECSVKLPTIKIYAIWRKNDCSPLLDKFLECL